MAKRRYSGERVDGIPSCFTEYVFDQLGKIAVRCNVPQSPKQMRMQRKKGRTLFRFTVG